MYHRKAGSGHIDFDSLASWLSLKTLYEIGVHEFNQFSRFHFVFGSIDVTYFFFFFFERIVS